VELAGFCDASERAYGAVVFLCIYSDHQDPDVTNMMSKTRVAPAKQVSLPRLKLCGAVLLANLMTTVKTAVKIPINQSRAWTDSTVVLGWLRKSPTSLQTFVTNRVTEATNHIPSGNWYHVAGKENPADCSSRVPTPEELKNHQLWWNGQSWLTETSHQSNEPQITINELAEISKEEKKVVIVHVAFPKLDTFILERYSSLQRIIRITACILRFKRNCVSKLKKPISSTNVDPLTYQEQRTALLVLVQKTQRQIFPQEMTTLTENGAVASNSSLLRLNPFLDEHRILRVGGRIRNSEVPPDQRFPILLPRHS
jgi:hypothetical protein